jgi:hypothetical protein
MISVGDIVKNDVVAALNCMFFCQDSGFNSLNQALIVMLPKKVDVVEMRDYRPISLVHSFEKIFSKLLTAMVGPRMLELVAINQSAFICGRSIMDNFIFVQSAIKTLHRKKAPTIFLKLDLARALDLVSWPFIMEVLCAHGFRELWCAWIISILLTSSSKIPINDHSTDRVWHRRVLRQGDPLSPLPFVINMDVFASLFLRLKTGLCLPHSRPFGQFLALAFCQ